MYPAATSTVIGKRGLTPKPTIGRREPVFETSAESCADLSTRNGRRPYPSTVAVIREQPGSIAHDSVARSRRVARVAQGKPLRPETAPGGVNEQACNSEMAAGVPR